MKKLLLSVFTVLVCSLTALAQTKPELQAGDSIKTVLEKQIGQIVDLRMKSGEKMGGKLEKVTDKLAHLSSLTGAEFYDAIIDLETVAAVAVRTKTK